MSYKETRDAAGHSTGVSLSMQDFSQDTCKEKPHPGVTNGQKRGQRIYLPCSLPFPILIDQRSPHGKQTLSPFHMHELAPQH